MKKKYPQQSTRERAKLTKPSDNKTGKYLKSDDTTIITGAIKNTGSH
jgi:hypothetical protein